MATNVYVLRLEKGRYYIGKSTNVERRFEQHLRGTATKWTAMFRPLAIDRIYKNVSPFEEDAITKEWMSIHGIHKVRGGSYSAPELENYQLKTLKREIWGATDCCFNCGRRNHLSNECLERFDICGDPIGDEWSSELVEDDYSSDLCEDDYSLSDNDEPREYTNDIRCSQCGEWGHISTECYDH